jgi:hypothetical protein
MDADFSGLHEISRHATHSTETLDVTIQSLKTVRQRHRELHEHAASTTAGTEASWKQSQQHMDFQVQLIHNLQLRSAANQERLQSEITLVLQPFIFQHPLLVN